MPPVIRVANLGKEYIIGGREQANQTFREMLTYSLATPFRRLRNLSGLGAEDERFWALKDVNFEVQQGEVVGIIGRNGAGKSTLLKILSRITDPTEGEVEIRGRVASLLEVGTGFHPELTGRENIYLNGSIMGMTRHEVARKFDEIVSFAEIDKFIDTPVKRYSSGMYVRLAFAVAAHLEPNVLVVDEVLAVGDIQFQEKCIGRLEKIANSGRAVLFVSHNLTAIGNLCGKAILLDSGRLCEHGSATEVVRRYINDFRSPIKLKNFEADLELICGDTIKIITIALTNNFGVALDGITTDTPFMVDINYEVLRTNTSVGMTIILRDSNNNYVFSSISNHEKNWYGRRMPKGLYHTTCLIPANFLNNGFFSLSVNIFGKGFSDAVMLDSVLYFEIEDGVHVRADYFGEYAGVVRPLLSWETNLVRLNDE